VNSSPFTLDTAPYIESGNSMFPIRFLAEQLGLQVDWDQPTSSGFVNDRAASNITSQTSSNDHIVVVVEENHSYNQILGSPDAPYMQSRGALFTNAHGATHPSQPNYLTLFSGSTQGVKDNGCKNRSQHKI
jgi:hypothetical protein